MKALEKAKLALREHLLTNKDVISNDLKRMRQISLGNDIFNYVEHLSQSFSLNEISSSKEIIFDYTFQDIQFYSLIEEINLNHLYSPPNVILSNKTKKGSEILSGLFFLI